jgi:hypothetical protein
VLGGSITYSAVAQRALSGKLRSQITTQFKAEFDENKTLHDEMDQNIRKYKVLINNHYNKNKEDTNAKAYLDNCATLQDIIAKKYPTVNGNSFFNNMPQKY